MIHAVYSDLMRMVLLSLGVALGVPTAEAEEAAIEIVGAPARLEGSADVLLVVAAAAEPVGAAAGVVAAVHTQTLN
jgi:hypothetical protein